MTEKNINCTNDVSEVYHTGDIFEYENELFILANVNYSVNYSRVQLISINDGNRWSGYVEVKNIHEITRYDNVIPAGFRKVKQLDVNYTI